MCQTKNCGGGCQTDALVKGFAKRSTVNLLYQFFAWINQHVKEYSLKGGQRWDSPVRGAGYESSTVHCRRSERSSTSILCMTSQFIRSEVDFLPTAFRILSAIITLSLTTPWTNSHRDQINGFYKSSPALAFPDFRRTNT